MNDPKFANASIMLSDMNFGCGSSREHAPQSLFRAGFRAIIAGNFAEIFFGNATNLGIPCVSMAEPERKVLAQFIEDSPSGSLVVDVDELKVRAEGLELPVYMRPGARDSLMNGRWDPLDELLQAKLEIQNISKSLPYV